MEGHDSPVAPSNSAVVEALAALIARAANGPARETYVRVGDHEGRFYIDLVNDKFEAIEVNDFGWRIVQEAPIPFLRYGGMEALPYPCRGGRIDQLAEYLNVFDRDAFKLIVAYCVNLMAPHGLYMLLSFTGAMGSLKSTATRSIRRLIDPSKVDLRAKPKSEQDLLISAQHNHVLTYENVSSISAEQADQLCRLATGAGISTRALYTDREENLLDTCKPLILGIPEVIERGDLADRAIMLVLPMFKGRRRTDEEVKREFDTVVRPKVLGCLLDGLARALAMGDFVSLSPDAPRMADFARRAIAAFPSFGWDEEDFMRAWRNYRSTLAEKSIEADSVANAVRQFMEEQATWEGEAGDLLERLTYLDVMRTDKFWPKVPNHLTNRLRRAMPMLSAAGIDIDLDRQDSLTRRRIISISKSANARMAA